MNYQAGIEKATEAAAFLKQEPISEEILKQGIQKAYSALSSFSPKAPTVPAPPSGPPPRPQSPVQPAIVQQKPVNPMTAIVPYGQPAQPGIMRKMPLDPTLETRLEELRKQGVGSATTRLAQSQLKRNIISQKVKNYFQQQANIAESKARTKAKLPLLLKNQGGGRRTHHRTRNQKKAAKHRASTHKRRSA